ncbi:hypothetical protein [Spongiibacter marinus]|uniref:hypothetical protein n=1 Tax=Spongiibacter marinus TaxID=354246 RepID=UPI0019612DF3|nr:hypothetical protein [Spongiibacter marinus]MBM7424965.1 hypothetical protein [Spongiibacter marinus]
MFKLGVDTPNMPNIQQMLASMPNEIPFATAKALTRTSKAVEVDLRATMERVFDRPKPFTVRSTFTKPATKRRLQSTVGLKDFAPKGTAAAQYLQAQIAGGKRRPKRSERALQYRGRLKPGQYMAPGRDARLNKYGNLTAAQVVKALSNVGGQIDTYQNTTSASAKRAGGRKYFWLPNNGIFWRQGKKLKSFMVIASNPNYRQRFDFYGVSQQSAERHLPDQVLRSVNEAISEAARRSGASSGRGGS